MTKLPIAKKSLGQHWLSDENTLQAIATSILINQADIVLEIGPGAGTLTDHLANKAKKVIAIEFDDQLANSLSKKFAGTNVQIINGDILTFDFSTLPSKYKVVANIPYYLTSNLLRILCELPNAPTEMALLVQKEVAERIAAEPGQASMLSNGVQLYYQPTLGVVVPAHLFTPPPKVDSQVIILHKRKQPLFAVDSRLFFRLLRAGFSEKRKKLRNTIAGGLGIDKPTAEAMLISAKIDPSLRPQQLSLNDWHNLYGVYYKQ